MISFNSYLFKPQLHGLGKHVRDSIGNLLANHKGLILGSSWQHDEEAVRVPVHHLGLPALRLLHQLNGSLQAFPGLANNAVSNLMKNTNISLSLVHLWHQTRTYICVAKT